MTKFREGWKFIDGYDFEDCRDLRKYLVVTVSKAACVIQNVTHLLEFGLGW